MPNTEPRTRLDYLLTELDGVVKFLHELRHNRGRWPKKWCRSMIYHYENREANLNSAVRRARQDTP